MFSSKMPLFGKSSKSPTEVVRNLKEDLIVLEKGGDQKKLEKVNLLQTVLKLSSHWNQF